MATKKEMITFIMENSVEFENNYLELLPYKQIKGFYVDVESKVNDLDKTPDDTVEDETPDDTVEDEKIEINLDEVIEQREVNVVEEVEKLIEVEEEWNFDKLSPNDQRLYRRTGIKRISKSKKYSRFNKENPKI